MEARILAMYLGCDVNTDDGIGTLQELVEYGKNNGGNMVNGMPWSFSLNGYNITYENDSCYLIPTPHLFRREDHTSRFTPEDVLLIGTFMGELTPITKAYFNDEFTED